MSGLSGVGYGGFNPAAIQLFQQNLFSQIDLNGDGSVSKSELEQAVNHAGGSTQAADALYSVLDPNNSGGFSEQQLGQVLPGVAFSDQMQAQIISFQAQGWPGAAQADGDPAQTLFSRIDSNGDGSISKAELEQAVAAIGGTQQAADALYAKLDPNRTGSVSEQQLASLLQSLPHYHHHHSGGGDGAGGNSAADALTSLFNADGGGPDNSPLQIAQNMFTQIDSNGDGSITQSELEQAVTAAGGSTAAADALYGKLDPNGTGSVSEQQFIAALQPPSASGNTAQDALLALINEATQSSATTAAVGATSTSTGTSAQDALLALIKASSTSSSSPAAQSAAGLFSQADLAHAFALYQNQLEQQLVSSIGSIQV